MGNVRRFTLDNEEITFYTGYTNYPKWLSDCIEQEQPQQFFRQILLPNHTKYYKIVIVRTKSDEKSR